MYQSMMRLALMVAAMAVGSPAFAGVCVDVGFGDADSDQAYTLVLKNVALKPGAAGAIAGYAVRDDGVFMPISGGFAVGPTTAAVSVTRSVAFFDANGAGGVRDETTFYSLSIPLNGADPSYCLWRRSQDHITTSDCAAATVVDCKSVPRIPKKSPASTGVTGVQ